MNLQDRAQEISEAIDNMTSLCSETRDDVRKLFEAMGVEFPSKSKVPTPKLGQAWRYKSDGVLAVVASVQGQRYFISLDGDCDVVAAIDNYNFVADDLQEYLKQGGVV